MTFFDIFNEGVGVVLFSSAARECGRDLGRIVGWLGTGGGGAVRSASASEGGVRS